MLNSKEKIYATSIGIWQWAAIRLAQKMVKPNPTTITKQELKDFLTGLGLPVPACHDELYYVDNWSKWLKAIEIDWTNTHRYLSNQYDCDNFSSSFNARMAEFYGWNTAGRYSIKLYEPGTDKFIGYHRASIIVAKNENSNLVAYAYDPMTGMNDEYTKITQDAITQIKNWQYVPRFISFN